MGRFLLIVCALALAGAPVCSADVSPERIGELRLADASGPRAIDGHAAASYLAWPAAPRPHETQQTGERYRELGFTWFRFEYAETVPAPFKSEESGWIPGIRYFQQDQHEATQNRLDLELGFGQTDYDGSLMDSDGGYAGPYKTQGPNFFLTFEGNWGRVTTKQESSVAVVPYVGLGVRYWHRGKYPSDPYGYNESYTWVYIPVGLRTQWRASERVSVSLDASVRPMVYGRISVENLISGTLGNETGYRVEAPITWRLSRGRAVEFRPWFEYYGFGRGNVYYEKWTVGYEPDSRTHIYGALLSMQYPF